MSVHTLSAVQDEWAEDLAHHRATYRESIFRWEREEVIECVRQATGGQLDFTTLRSLQTLNTALTHTRTTEQQTRLALGAPLLRAAAYCGWDDVSTHLDLEAAAARAISRRADTAHVRERTNATVRRCSCGLGANPLILAWEIKQGWKMWSAASGVIEHTRDTLLWELRHEHGHNLDELQPHSGLTAAEAEARIQAVADTQDRARLATLPTQMC